VDFALGEEHRCEYPLLPLALPSPPPPPRETKENKNAVSAGRVLLCAKRPLFFSADYFSLCATAVLQSLAFLAPMYFALYGLEMDVWNTLFTLLGSTLVICAAKFISTVYWFEISVGGRVTSAPLRFLFAAPPIGNARRVVPNIGHASRPFSATHGPLLFVYLFLLSPVRVPIFNYCK
jgi:hypothetical protein